MITQALRLCLVIPQLVHIRTLGEIYVESQLTKMELLKAVQDTEFNHDSSIDNGNYKEIPVKLPNFQGYTYAKISTEDYANVTSTSTSWRLCSSGYPLHVKRSGNKFETIYLHRLIHGSPAKHVNGDRLDNRRTNLVTSARLTSKKRSVDHISEEDEFDLHTPRVISEEISIFHSDDNDLKQFTGYGRVSYHEDNKIYSGELVDGRPHGHGCLYEQQTQQQSSGEWKSGRMMNGMVVKYKDLPLCMCQVDMACPFREILRVDVVKNGYKI